MDFCEWTESGWAGAIQPYPGGALSLASGETAVERGVVRT
jgi:hypothetical protein